MGNNGHHHFTSVCEKILGAVFPTYHPNRHSHHQQQQSFPDPVPMSLPNHHHNYGSNSIAITPPTHVSYHQNKHMPKADHIMNPPNKLLIEQSHDQGSAKSTSYIQAKQHINEPRSEPLAKDVDDPFSEYINHAKIKIRAMSSNVGGEEIIASRVEDIDETGKSEDEFSAYINRAKVMIRKTSTIGSANSISFKRD
ncbi:hypothetical protein FNV43_RR02750 [Rhamnella rubrinervis]|uniref:Uncharacterized protein n=1 Tax=Rhamnella rubrinervis TaxID=2594499 RepID=A0A8K0MN88_9ROSA|nr:hypothetical protein FNV43_RR02750 [Rhamnella rubrinervis]